MRSLRSHAGPSRISALGEPYAPSSQYQGIRGTPQIVFRLKLGFSTPLRLPLRARGLVVVDACPQAAAPKGFSRHKTRLRASNLEPGEGGSAFQEAVIRHKAQVNQSLRIASLDPVQAWLARVLSPVGLYRNVSNPASSGRRKERPLAPSGAKGRGARLWEGTPPYIASRRLGAIRLLYPPPRGLSPRPPRASYRLRQASEPRATLRAEIRVARN
jgi:hypothetical protein